MTTENIPLFEDLYQKVSDHSHKKVIINCDYQIVEKCEGIYVRAYREVIITRQRNDNTFICLRCSRFIKNSGRNNPNCKYIFNDKMLKNIDTERKAYLLGWIASDGSIRKGEISIGIHEKDIDILEELRDIICTDLNIKSVKNLVILRISSSRIAVDACKHLSISPGKKDTSVKFPEHLDANLQWDFLRGYFDGDGSISNRKCGYPRCNISSNSIDMLKSIKKLSNSKCAIYRNKIEWTGTSAVDFLGRLYQNASLMMSRKYTIFLTIIDWRPKDLKLRWNPINKKMPIFKWSRTCQEAFKPQKSRFSDTGYDLHIIKKLKVKNNVHYFDTCIQVQPEYGYYFDLVGRSSISKSGWMLANNIGIIDCTYIGSIIVALIKVNPDAEEIELPARLVQLIPRTLLMIEPVEVESLDDTDIGDGGFGSSGK